MPESPFHQQIPGVVPQIVQPLAIPLVRFLLGWTKRMLPWLAVFSLVFIGYDYFLKWRDRPISFLLGPPGGESANQGEKLQNEFKKWTFLGPNYSITPVHTEGFQENIARIGGDLEGNIVGFGMDGLKGSGGDSVRTILPLDWYYLHFLFRNEALEKYNLSLPIAKEGSVLAKPVKFSELAARMRDKSQPEEKRKRRLPLYLGPRGSGTRNVADFLLEYAMIPPDEVEATGIADFQAMVSALRQGRIDGAFFVTSAGSATVKRAIKEADCTLISIDDATQLANTVTYLEKCSIPASTYRYVESRASLEEVDSLAVRRVLVAPASMSATDAHQIATHVQSTFPGHVSRPLSEDYQYPGPGPRTSENLKRLKFDVHSGAVLGSSAVLPPTWFDRHAYWLAPLVFAMIISFIGAWKSDMTRWLERHLPTEGSGAGNRHAGTIEQDQAEGNQMQARADAGDPMKRPAHEYADIGALIEVILNDMHLVGDAIFPSGELPTKSTLGRWQDEIAHVYERIYAGRHAGQLATTESLELKQRAFGLQQELEFLRKPPWKPAVTKSRRTSKPAAAKDGEEGNVRPTEDSKGGSGE